MLVDTHCHLNFHPYDADRDVVVRRAEQAGVTRIVIPAIDFASGEQALTLAAQYSGVYAAVGVHPNDVSETGDFDFLLAQARRQKVVAIGEIGLDYYWNKFPRARQIAAFETQLALAAALELPVIIHNRDSSADVLAVLEVWVRALPSVLRDRPGVLHSVSAPPEYVERALAAGFYVGFTGPITYKKAVETRALAAAVPLDRILVETDGPYLTPEPYRGKRNEPSYIPFIVEKIAEARGITPAEAARATTANAERLFRFSA